MVNNGCLSVTRVTFILHYTLLLQGGITLGQQFFSGVCPNPTPIQNLNRTQYSGVWYLIQQYEYAIGHTFSCALGHYFLPAFDGTWNFFQNYTERVSGTKISIPGRITFLSEDGSAYLNADNYVDLPLPLPIKTDPWDLELVLRIPYWVLATDYTTYTVEWTCKTIGYSNLQFLWILSRTKSLSADELQSIRALVDSTGLQTSKLVTYDTSGC